MAKINQVEIDGTTYDLQDKSIFTGTQSEVNSAISNGTIKEGDIVNITDDAGESSSGILDSLEEIMANTASGKVAGALGVKEGFEQINESLSPINITSKITVANNAISTEGSRLCYLPATKNIGGNLRIYNSAYFTANAWTTAGYMPNEYRGFGSGALPCIFEDGSTGCVQILSTGEIKVYATVANKSTAHTTVNYYLIS